MSSIRKEFQDVYDKWSAAKSDGKITRVEAHQIARELFDPIKMIVDGGASASERSQLASELSVVLAMLIDMALEGKPVIQRIAQAFAGSMARDIVDQAAQYTGSAADFLRINVLPITQEWETTLHEWNKAIS